MSNVRVTDLYYPMNLYLKGKLDIMIDRTTNRKFDNLVIIDGDEGTGKTTLAADLSYYVSFRANRTYPKNCSRIFFDVDKMINFATKTEQQIIHWDEAALGGLASQSYQRVQIKLLQLLMVARKKRHFYIFCIPKFFRLKEGIIERAVALVHVYARKQVEQGHYAYFRKSALQNLYEDWRTTKKKRYFKFKSFVGEFTDNFANIVDEHIYDKLKDEAILSIGKESLVKRDVDLLRMKYIISKTPYMSQEDKLKAFGITKSTLTSWKKLPEKNPTINFSEFITDDSKDEDIIEDESDDNEEKDLKDIEFEEKKLKSEEEDEL